MLSVALPSIADDLPPDAGNRTFRAVESAPRRYSGMATGVVTTSANLGGIIGITLTSVALGESAGLDAFQTIFGLHLAMSLVGTLITTRVEPWPVSEEDARAAVGTS